MPGIRLFPSLTVSLLLGALAPAHGRPLLDTAFRGFPAGKVPYGIATGDLNGDGRDDLLVTNEDGAAILLSGPERTFGAPLHLDLPHLRVLTIAPTEGDAHADLVVLPWDEPIALRYAGRGDATFAPPDTLALPGLGVGTIIRDLDGDGQADIAIAAGTSVIVKYAGTDVPDRIAVGLGTSGLLSGDIDGDGRPDLIVPQTYLPGFVVLRNSGARAFGAPNPYTVPRPKGPIAVGDFDGDGRADVAAEEKDAYGGAGQIDVFAGSADGQLASPYAFLPSGGWMVSADVDGDRRDDLVISAGRGFSVYRGTDLGLSRSAETYWGRAPSPPLALGDFDGDSSLDVAAVEPTPTGGVPECTFWKGQSAFAWFGKADGTFPRDEPAVPMQRAWFVTTTDYDHDGARDLFAGSGSSIVRAHGKGEGRFEAPVAVDSTAVEALEALDFDGDGDPELLVEDFDRRLRLFDIASDGSLSLKWMRILESPGRVIVRDFDGDGKPDIVVAETNARALRLLHADGSDGPTTPLALRPYSVTSADLDRNGTPDLVVGGSFDNWWVQGSLLSLSGNGDGSFVQRDSLRTEGAAVAAAAVDRAGEDPLVVTVRTYDGCPASPGPTNLYVSVDGVFAPRELSAEDAARLTWIEFEDLDGDGRADFLGSNRLGEFVVRRAHPDGTFADPEIYGLPVSAESFEVVDIDHDGRKDVMVAAETGILLLRNVGGTPLAELEPAARIGGGLPEAILQADVPHAVTFTLAGDVAHEVAAIVPSSVRLAGASPLAGSEVVQDGTKRQMSPIDACHSVADGGDGFADLTLTFPSADVIEGWRRTGPAPDRDGEKARVVGLPWSAVLRDGSRVAGVACAVVIGDGRSSSATPGFAAYGPRSDRDLGVGVTLALPRSVTTAEIDLFDLRGRRVAVLARGPLDPGFHRIAWTAPHPRPGIYFARATLDGEILTTRVLVLR